MRFKKTLSTLLSLTVIISAAFGYAAPAQAKSSRAAQVVEVVGDVQIIKAGGSKSYRAFAGMTLNQGDHLETGKGAKVVLKVTDHDDELTIDQNSSLYISELTEQNGGKKSKVKMWAGSLWSKVKTLAGAEDEFEVETPTAVMGVRGTNLFAGVDQESGDSTFMIGSGFGEVTKSGSDDNGSVFLFPSQQLKLLFGDAAADLGNNVSVINLDSFIAFAGPGIIEAIVQNKAALDQENAEFIEKQKQNIAEGQINPEAEQMGIANLDDLNRVANNLDNLIGNIVKKAIEQNKVDAEKIQQMINKVNETAEKKLDLTQVKPLELTQAQQQKLDEIKRLEEERKKQLEEEKKRQEELKKQNEELVKKLEEQRKKQEEEKKKKAEEDKKKAEEEYKKHLDAAAQAEFENRKKELEQQQQQQQQEAQQNTNVNNQGTESTGGTDAGQSPPEDQPGKLILEKKLLDDGGVALVVSVENLTGNNKLKGLQLDFVYDNRIFAVPAYVDGQTDHVLDDGTVDSVSLFRSNIAVDVAGRESELTGIAYAPELAEQTVSFYETLYSEVKGTSGNKEITEKKFVMTVIFYVNSSVINNDNLKVLLKKAMFVRQDGAAIPIAPSVQADGYVIDFSSASIPVYSGAVNPDVR